MYPAITHFATYSFYDYMEDELFRQWVQEPTLEGNSYFSQVLVAYPVQRRPMREARLLLLIFKSTFSPPRERQLEQLHEKAVGLFGHRFD